MTDDKKALAAGNHLVGFRVGPDGVVEALTEREVDVMIARVIREAIEASLSVRRALH
jgi:hypothetical protein